MRPLLLLAVAPLLFIESGHAQSPHPDLEAHLKVEHSRFRAFEPNYGLWQWTEDDDQALEARYSFKYLFTSPDCTDKNRSKNKTQNECIEGYWSRWDAFIAYTGEFDFYMKTRDSSPVINRINNPSFHARRYFAKNDGKNYASLNYIDVGFQHLSNGQTFEADIMENGAFVTQIEFLANPDSPFFDSVSRTVNFVSAEANFRLGKRRRELHPVTGRCGGLSGCYDLWVRLIPWYVSDDNPVTWGPDAGRVDSIADYERMRFILSYKRDFNIDPQRIWFRSLEWSLMWRLGDELLDTDSAELTVFFPLQIGSRNWSLPFYAQYHYGPMNNLSNFTRNQNSFGIGLRFY